MKLDLSKRRNVVMFFRGVLVLPGTVCIERCVGTVD